METNNDGENNRDGMPVKPPIKPILKLTKRRGVSGGSAKHSKSATYVVLHQVGTKNQGVSQCKAKKYNIKKQGKSWQSYKKK